MWDGGIQYIRLLMQSNGDDVLIKSLRDKYMKEFTKDELDSINNNINISVATLTHVNYATSYLDRNDARRLWSHMSWFEKMCQLWRDL